MILLTAGNKLIGRLLRPENGTLTVLDTGIIFEDFQACGYTRFFQTQVKHMANWSGNQVCYCFQ